MRESAFAFCKIVSVNGLRASFAFLQKPVTGGGLKVEMRGRRHARPRGWFPAGDNFARDATTRTN